MLKQIAANTTLQINIRKENSTIEVSHDEDHTVSKIQTKSIPNFLLLVTVFTFNHLRKFHACLSNVTINNKVQFGSKHIWTYSFQPNVAIEETIHVLMSHVTCLEHKCK